MRSIDKENLQFITPMMLPLNKRIEADAYYLGLPEELKRELFDLEEMRAKAFNDERFIKDVYSLPMRDFVNVTTRYLPGVVDVKAVKLHGDSRHWLVSTSEIPTQLVVEILKLWIENHYQHEPSYKLQKGINETLWETVKERAEKLRTSLSACAFEECSFKEHLVLTDEHQVQNGEIYRLLPLLIAEKMKGAEVSVQGRRSYWMISGKNEITTNPLDYYGGNRESAPLSFAVQFTIQTIPPESHPYLNIDITSRRWAVQNGAADSFQNQKSETESAAFDSNKTSRNTSLPYLNDAKSIYFRISDTVLQPLECEFSGQGKCLQWLPGDSDVFQIIYHRQWAASPEDILLHPENYRQGKTTDAYPVYEFGMRANSRRMNMADAGITHRDRQEIFDAIVKDLAEFTTGKVTAQKAAKSFPSLTETYFDPKTFELTEKGRPQFEEMVHAAFPTGNLTFEVCVSAGQEAIRDVFMGLLKNHFQGLPVQIKQVDITGLADDLERGDNVYVKNIAGMNKRKEEVGAQMGQAQGTVLSFVLIKGLDYYAHNKDGVQRIQDPKAALRQGFLSTGRLTQFVTVGEGGLQLNLDKRESESYLQKEKMIIAHALLDGYRQLGLTNAPKVNKDGDLPTSLLNDHLAVGIHAMNCSIMNGKGATIRLNNVPLIVSYDVKKQEVRAFTKVKSKWGGAKTIDCLYREFPLRFNDYLAQFRKWDEVSAAEDYLRSWWSTISPEMKCEFMFESNKYTRAILKGISNKDIFEANGNVLERFLEMNQIPRDTTTLSPNTYHLSSETNSLSSDTKDLSRDSSTGQSSVSLEEAKSRLILLRLRTNNEVPDYVAAEKADGNFRALTGLFAYDKVYYSLDNRTSNEGYAYAADASRTGTNDAYSHRNLVEIYPLYAGSDENITQAAFQVDAQTVTQDAFLAACDVHALRAAHIQYTAQRTILPLPLHLAKGVEEYLGKE